MRTPRAASRSAPPLPKGTGTRHVYEAIRRRILGLELRPGADLDEASLVRALGVSRTPVRESLIRLSSEGLVVLLPNRGARVAPLDLANVQDFFEALELCQRAVTRWAAVRRTEEHIAVMDRHRLAFEKMAARRDPAGMNETNRDFHLAIAVAGGNAHLTEAYDRLLSEGLRLSHMSLAYGSIDGGPTDLDRIVHEHRQMVRAIRAGAGDRGDALASAHTATFRARIVTFLQSSLAHSVKL